MLDIRTNYVGLFKDASVADDRMLFDFWVTPQFLCHSDVKEADEVPASRQSYLDLTDPSSGILLDALFFVVTM